MTGYKLVSATFNKVPSGVARRFCHKDTIGSVRAITDALGLVLARHDSGPFGEDTAAMTGDPIRFTAKELDPETGLHYFDTRYLRQSWGRFSQPDPIARSMPVTKAEMAQVNLHPQRFHGAWNDVIRRRARQVTT